MLRTFASLCPRSVALRPSPWQYGGDLFRVRLIHSSVVVQRANVQALTGYAFAGKPRQSMQEEDGDSSKAQTGLETPPSTPKELTRQGFPKDTRVGVWVDQMLKGGEAGEDMLAVTSMRGEGDLLMAVADGVGGWSENGIDPALFSQALMYHASTYAKNYYACPDRMAAEDLAGEQTDKDVQVYGQSTPTDILEHAYRRVEQEEAAVLAGSSTACLLTFDASKGVLRSANLGDSGFVILRPKRPSAKGTSNQANMASTEDEQNIHTLQYQSHPQLHGFNTPYQLSKLPPSFRSVDSIDSKPKDAHVSETHVREGDIVLLATDGFWDNVSTSEVLQLVAFVRQKHRSAWQKEIRDSDKATAAAYRQDSLAEERDLASVLSHNLLQYALMCQFSTTKTSPFEREAARHGIHFPGGKVDDISIVSALIVER